MSVQLRQLEINTKERVETGVIQFVLNGRKDWPSLHIRGDCAANFAMRLNQAIEKLEEIKHSNNFMIISELKSIRDMIWGDVIVAGYNPKQNETTEFPECDTCDCGDYERCHPRSFSNISLVF